MNLKKLLVLIAFIGIGTFSYAQTTDDFPWLEGVLDEENCCSNQTVSVFPFSSYSFVYVAPNESCTNNNSTLYFDDGRTWCIGDECLSAYGLDLANAVNIYNCNSAVDNFTIFDEYTWLSTVVDEANCCSEQNIQVIDLGAFSFVYITGDESCPDGLGKLYFETGELYCSDASNYNCLLAYGFSGMSLNTVWSCGGTTNVEPEPELEPEETLSINESFFNSAALVSFTTVNCTLENGSATTCYEMVFTSNPVENGPYCPSTIDEIGGVGIYDGNTNPGFQVLKRSLWEAMEADGFDIVDEDGNITIVDPGAGGDGGGPPAEGGPDGGGPPTGGGPGGDDAAAGGVTSACLEAAPDDELLLTFLIPVTPELLSTPDVMETVENIGISVDGIPLTGDPPSVTMSTGGMPGGGGAIPSIDPCGGHMDPSGYYHLHFVPEEMNNIYEAHGITEVSCTNFAQSETALVGFAKDGFPIYASKDDNGELPADLDACNGHIAPTTAFPGGTYHYHASSNLAPNVPPCLVGASVRNSFSFASTDAGGENTGDTGGADTGTGEVLDVDSALFLTDDTNLRVTLVPCTLSDGTETDCYEIITNSTPIDHEMGPWCPDNISDDASAGGIWLESGEVFDVDGAFIENMANFYNDNTWMMYDANGDIFVTETEEDCINAANPNVGDAYQNFCVECLPAYITDLSQTWTIPVTPVIQEDFAFFNTGPGGANTLPSTRGIALNGVEFSAPAPVNNILSAYTLAPFDDAGGHINVNQGYHYHAATGVSTAVAQSDGHAPLIGYALDGHGIYAQLDDNGIEPSGLDACRGHFDAIRGYHYHVDAAGNNNFINCLAGAYVVDADGGGIISN